MKKELLKDVVKAIENRPPDIIFDMRYWKKMNCNTAACAIGCYCIMNPDVDLKLVPSYVSEFGEQFHHPIMIDGKPRSVERYFDISSGAVDYLFDNGSYATNNSGDIDPQSVIDRILVFIASNGDIPSDFFENIDDE